MNKYTIKTTAIYSDIVEVEANTVKEAEILAHQQAEYEYDYWDDSELVWADNKDE